MSFEREIEDREFDKLQKFRAEKAARDKLDGGSAFPSHGSMGEVEHRGMSLLDYFAGQITAGFCSEIGQSPLPINKGESTDEALYRFWSDRAHAAYIAAGAMLAERAKQEPKP